MSFLDIKEPALSHLADEIAVHTRELQQYYDTNQVPQPSFHRDGPSNILPFDAPSATHRSRAKLADAAFKLYQLATGPSEIMSTLRGNFQSITALHWLLHFRIFIHVPLEGSIPYDALAAQADVPETRLKSVIRLAMTNGMFAETTPDTVEHTSFSIFFAKNPDQVAANLFSFEVTIPTAMKMVAATERWPDSVEKNQTAHNIAFGHDTSYFEWLSADDARTKQFAMYMRSVAGNQSMDVRHLVNAFGIQELPASGIVVDVGGSAGHCSLALAQAFPDLRFDVQDLPETVKGGQDFMSSQPDTIRSRISFRGHDFFQPQPVQGADVYLLRMILHDWPDQEAQAILQSLFNAMDRHSLIMVMDTVLPKPGTLPATTERLVRLRDLVMRQKFNARERSLDDWREIVGKVSPELKIKEVYQPEHSDMASIIIGFP